MFSESTTYHIFFHCHDQRILFCRRKNCFLIERCHKAGIHNSCRNFSLRKLFLNLPCSLYHSSDCKKRYIRAFAQHLRPALHNRCTHFLPQITRIASWITDCDRIIRSNRKFKHIGKLPLILRRHNRKIRNRRQIGQIKDSLMRCTILAYNSSSINRKHNRKLLQTNIVQNLIVRSLQER